MDTALNAKDLLQYHLKHGVMLKLFLVGIPISFPFLQGNLS